MMISSYPFSCICSFFNTFTTGLCDLDDMFHWHFLCSRRICFCSQLLVDSFFATNKYLFDSLSKVESELGEEFTDIFGFSPDDDAAVKAAFESGDMEKQMNQYMKLVNKKLPEILASEDTEEDTGVRDIDSDFQKELDAFDKSHPISSASSAGVSTGISTGISTGGISGVVSSIGSSDVWEPGFESMDVETFGSGPCIRCPPDATKMLLRVTDVVENKYIRKYMGKGFEYFGGKKPYSAVMKLYAIQKRWAIKRADKGKGVWLCYYWTDATFPIRLLHPRIKSIK